MRKIILLLCLALTSCGFHWRNSYPPLAAKIYVQGPDSAFVQNLASNLQQAGVSITATRAQAQLVLVILRQDFVSNTLPLGIGQQLNKINLAYRVTLVLRTPAGQDKGFPVTLLSHAIYLQNANQVLGDMTALPNIQAELSVDMIQKIIAYLNTYAH